ncbi:MAG: agarase [Lentisphaerae bacterium]|nr:agarase [Lentisphaerota bacterium]
MIRKFLCASMLLIAMGTTATMFAAEPLKIAVRQGSEWKELDTWTVAHAAGFQPRTEPAKLSVYGGDPSRKVEATGFFRTQKIGERWWLVDPEGNLFITVALGCVYPAHNTPKSEAAFEAKFGSDEKWAEQTVALMLENGFNGSGAWSKNALLAKVPKRIAYCPIWDFKKSYKGGKRPFLFDPEFETFAMEHAKQLAATKDDPWLLGHFSDNELEFSKKNSRVLEECLGQPKEDYRYEAAWKWLQARKGEQADPNAIAREDQEAFAAFADEWYFAVVSKAIKTHDPNHLYLGCRFFSDNQGSANLFRAAGKYADVVSLNLYGTWTPDDKKMANWAGWSGKPYIISEFYARGEDSGLPNTTGAGWTVKTQKDRGLYYQNLCLGLLESKGCVGFHNFRYQDNDPDDKKVDPSNRTSNKGIVTAYFDEYPEYLKPIKELNLNVYDLIDWMDKGGRVHP